MVIKNLTKIIVCLISLLFASIGQATIYYVGPSGSGTTCSDPSPCLLSYANGQVSAGDTVILKDGTYSNSSDHIINPGANGSSWSNMITYETESGGTATLQRNSGSTNPRPIHLEGDSYIHIKGPIGLAVGVNSTEAIILHGASYVIIEDIEISGNYNYPIDINNTGNFTRAAASYITLRNINFTYTYNCGATPYPYEQIVIRSASTGSTHHILVEDSTFLDSEHGAIYSNHNSSGGYRTYHVIIRNNTIANRAESGIQILVDEGYNPTSVNSRSYLVENNQIQNGGLTDAGSNLCDGEKGTAIEMASSYNIVRYNDFQNSGYYGVGGDLGGTDFYAGGTSEGDAHVIDNHFYNNNITDMPQWYGWKTSAPDPTEYDSNAFVNNAFYANFDGSNFETYWECPGGGSWSSDDPCDIWRNNLIGDTGNSIRLLCGELSINVTTDPSTANSSYDSCASDRFVYEGNIQGTPGWTAASSHDFSIGTSSPLFNAGGRLTDVATADTGSGISLVVDDAGFFFDGWGFPSQMGTIEADWIAVGSVSNVVQISSINYSTNTITLVSGISRNDGDDVWLFKDSDGTQVLYGPAPDIGAHELNYTGSSIRSIEGGGGNLTIN